MIIGVKGNPSRLFQKHLETLQHLTTADVLSGNLKVLEKICTYHFVNLKCIFQKIECNEPRG